MKWKFLSSKDWTRKDWGRNAITGLLGGFILASSGIIFIEVIGSVVSLLGLVCGLVWIYKKIKNEA